MLALGSSLLPRLIELVLAAGPMGDGPAGSTLRWEAPPQCPDRAGLLAMIDATLGEVSDDERHAVDVRAEVWPSEPEGFVLRLELDGGEGGTRELRGASCQELSEAAALLIAMAIDPRAIERRVEDPTQTVPESLAPPSDEPEREEPEPVPSPSDEPVRDGPPSDPTASEPPVDTAPSLAPSRARPRWLARVEAGVGGGPLPGAAAVLGVAAGLGGRGWRAELSAAYWTPRTATSPNNPAIGARAQLWALGLHGCGEPRWRTLSFPLCVEVLAGAVHARGVGELQPQSVVTRWVALGLEPGLVWWVRPRLGLVVRGEGHAAVARPELRAEPSGTVFLGAPVGGSLRGGLELRLP